MPLIILDSNVAAKLVIDEADSQQAIALIQYCVAQRFDIVVPELFRYEIASIVTRAQLNTLQIMAFFESQIDHIVQYRNPNLKEWVKAQQLVNDGHPKSGYPSLYDSIYHAMAIESEGVFVTADKRHYEKTQAYEHIALLSDWKKVL